MLKSLFYQVVSALSFTSNLYYLKATSSYFTDSADSFIFLHTWSLSVEWQFYLIFPVILVMSNYMAKRFGGYLVYSSLIFLSFCFCIFLTKHNQTYSFYLLPSRAWELMIGAMASSVTIKNRFPRCTEIIALIVLVSFTAIVKESSNWPGFETLIPTLATALLLHANVGNEKTLLRAKPFQVVGSASYSIYLFHWPVVSLFYLNGIEFNIFSQVVGVFVSLVLGFLSYNYIEKRRNVKITSLAMTALLLCMTAFVGSKFNISRYWMNDSILAMDKFHSYSSSQEGIYQFGNMQRICFLTSGYNSASQFEEDKCLIKDGSNGKPRLLLIGDSHAAEFYAAAKEVYKDHQIMQVTSSGCMPFMNSLGEKRCTELMSKFYEEYIKQYNIDTIIISANWIDGKQYFSRAQLSDNLINTVKLLSGYAKNVYVFGQTKVYDTPFYRIALLNEYSGIKKHELKEPKELNSYLKEYLTSRGVNYIDLYNFGCGDDKCTYMSNSNYPIMFDNNHFTLPWTKSILMNSSLEGKG
jgi:hypothetical protein